MPQPSYFGVKWQLRQLLALNQIQIIKSPEPGLLHCRYRSNQNGVRFLQWLISPSVRHLLSFSANGTASFATATAVVSFSLDKEIWTPGAFLLPSFQACCTKATIFCKWVVFAFSRSLHVGWAKTTRLPGFPLHHPNWNCLFIQPGQEFTLQFPWLA